MHERDSCPGHVKNSCFSTNKLQSYYTIILPTAWLNILLNLWGWYRCKLLQIVSDQEVNICYSLTAADSAFRQILARSKWMCCLCKNNVNEVWSDELVCECSLGKSIGLPPLLDSSRILTMGASFLTNIGAPCCSCA